eukprot:12933045-Prorocentrum_lima.AAC.1
MAPATPRREASTIALTQQKQGMQQAYNSGAQRARLGAKTGGGFGLATPGAAAPSIGHGANTREG